MHVFPTFLRKFAHEQYTRGRFRLALVLLRFAGMMGGKDSWLLDFTGLINRELGRKEAAIADFRAAIVLDPGNNRALKRLAYLASTHGQPDEALECVRSLVAKGEVSGELIQNVVARVTARGYPRREALPWFRLASRLDPSLKWARLSEAHCLREMGNLGEAQSIYQGLTADQDDQELATLARISFVTTLFLQGDEEGARAAGNQLATEVDVEGVDDGLRQEVHSLIRWLANNGIVDEKTPGDGAGALFPDAEERNSAQGEVPPSPLRQD